MKPFLNESNLNLLLEKLKPFDPLLIYGFGSVAEKRERPDSDIDIAYLCGSELSEVENFHLAQELASTFGRDVDLVPLKTANTVLKSQILKNGKLLFSKNKRIQQEFEMYTLSDYARLNEERKPILDRIAKEGKIYGF